MELLDNNQHLFLTQNEYQNINKILPFGFYLEERKEKP